MKRWKDFSKFALLSVLALGLSAPLSAATLSRDIPAWLQRHVGAGDGQIAPVVLARARAHHQRQVRKSRVRNPCYMAMDATRPSTSSSGKPAKRYYVICENQRSFWAVSSGFGNGRKLPQANFANGRECARHFSNALDSKLTMGGEYLTAEPRTSHKGYVRQSGQSVPFNRTFLVFEGMGETSNARDRAIGGHMAAFVRWQCRKLAPNNRYADDQGFIRHGKLIDYTSGRSNGCTTWSQDATQRILSLVDGNRTTLYIYPESRDIKAVAAAVGKGISPANQGLYWNASCLKQIGAPKFWPKRKLEPVIRKWRRSLPASVPRELPLCQ
ncbi:murein L,D-transpeptidase catalytic domain-containing protein [Planktotalea sp.]|uniref:murein L,D-transpeptidase catalytic domain-containing protein n=1 Tax=Planktotalea sp. TaxID=2029877 RepID=UPI003D6BA0CA